jgi:hypothetical protein
MRSRMLGIRAGLATLTMPLNSKGSTHLLQPGSSNGQSFEN